MSRNKHSPWSYSDFGLRPSFGFRISAFGFLCLCSLLAAGCKKSPPPDEPRTQTSPSTLDTRHSTLSTIHWLGKKRIAAGPNSTGFMKIWNLPESARVEAQTLDKLSTAPWRLLKVGTIPSAITNALTPIGASPLLRPLLDDLVQEECYVEIRQPTNQPSEVILAIKLDETRARLWETNLAAVVESLGGTLTAQPGTGHGWQMEFTHHALVAPKPGEGGSRVTRHLELTRARDWTILSLGAPASVPASSRDLVSRIERDHTPFPTPATNFWLSVDGFDLRPLVNAVGLSRMLPGELPKLTMTVIGDGENVLTRGQFDFSHPLNLNLEPWKIPTNLISGPVTSFTAVRGFQSWLTAFKPWRDLQIGAAPNQLFVWALQTSIIPATFFATPQADAEAQVSKLTNLILQKGSKVFETNPIVRFERSQTYNGLEWKGVPYVLPFLKSASTNGCEFVFGGAFAPAFASSPVPAELLQQLFGRKNLVFYDWELTGPRSDQWIYTGQFIRYAAFIPQMEPDLPSQHWLKTVCLQLANCGTVVTYTGPNQLSFVRRSGVGFTAFELHLLADWLESPVFPRGLHSIEPLSTGPLSN